MVLLEASGAGAGGAVGVSGAWDAAKAAAEAEANKPETTEQILNDIRELLKSLQPAQAAAIQKSVDKATADKQ